MPQVTLREIDRNKEYYIYFIKSEDGGCEISIKNIATNEMISIFEFDTIDEQSIIDYLTTPYSKTKITNET